MYIKNFECQSSPEFLASERDLVTFSTTVNSNHPKVITVGCRKILKAGTYLPDETNPVGILFHDVDLTGVESQPASIMVEGYVYEDRLPVPIPATLINIKAKPQL